MRKNARWSNSSSHFYSRNTALAGNMGLRRGTHGTSERPTRENREADLMGGFDDLRRELRHIQDIRELSLTSLLSPFLSLIRSPLSTGPITSTVLSSLHTFFVYGLITPTSGGIQPALSSLCTAVSRLRFEGTDPTADEIVLLRMLVVLEACLTGDVGDLLGDVEVCELLETVLTICCQMRRSELLRRKAELTMHLLVRTLFSRLATINPLDAEKNLEEEDGYEKSRVKAQKPAPVSSDVAKGQSETLTEPNAAASRALTPISISSAPYGLLSIRELLRVVVNLLDPTNPLHTDSIRLTALGILNSSLEVSSTYLASFPSLSSILIDKGCKFLFQLAGSENLQILYLSLRVITILFQEDSLLKQLKLQQELFLSFTLDRLAPPVIPNGPQVHLSVGGRGHMSNASRSSLSSRHGVASPEPNDGDSSIDEIPAPLPRLRVQPARGETRELLLEALANMSRQPSFFANLWVNYDCDKNCEDLFERLINYLTKYPINVEAQQYSSQLLCLDILLSLIHSMAVRAEHTPPSNPPLPTPDELKKQKAYKKLFLAGTARFNAKPKLGLAFLEENGLLFNDDPADVFRARSIAKFLKNAARLDKRLLGEFISRSENAEILKEFISLYDFQNKSIAEALRELLESFRLPGEAQQISRITETFASIYFATEPAEIQSEDAVYVLAYAVIMLNTDQHSPNIRKRMTEEDFQRNLRGVNFGSDFPPDYLHSIYENIREREIIMPEEHTGQAGFDYAWKELLVRTDISGSLFLCNTSIYDSSMFAMAWKFIVTSIASAFTTFDDEFVIQDVIAGFRECATLARKFELPEVFDYIVMSLSHATGLLGDPGITSAANFPTAEVDGQTVTVSTLSIRFGTSFRGQLAAVVLFTIANGNGNAIRDGWSQIFEMFQTLFLYSLLPTRMLQTEDFLGGVSMIPMQGNAASPVHGPNRSDGGLLSALSSYLLTPYGTAVEAAVPSLYNEIMQLDLDALVAAVRALAELADRRTTIRLSETDDLTLRLHEVADFRALPYDPASVFLLETLVSITVQTSSKIEEIWPIAFSHIAGILASPKRFSILLVERAVVGLLRIALILASQKSLRDQLYIALDLLGGLPLPIVNAVAEQLISGVALIVRKHREVISSATEWSLVFALLRGAVSHHEAGKLAFDVVSELAESLGVEGNRRVESLPALIAILEEFASVPGRAVELRVSKRPQPNVTVTSPNLERAIKAIELVYRLRSAVPAWIEQSTLSVDQAWKVGWTPLLVVLGRQSADLSAEVRNLALNCLQRLLLGQQISEHGLDVLHLFDRVIFPMVADLLRSDLDNKSLKGVSESRLRASNLLCKAFLHFQLGPNSELNSTFRESWLIVLDLLDRLMHSAGRQSQLIEAIPESLKNVLLVMHSSGILIPPSNPDGRSDQQLLLWNETNHRLSRFLPGLLDELIPASPLPSLPREATSEPVNENTEAPSEVAL
ncbi:uncharacterized protein EI90DRAFT_3062037 [Cantharellus anzutake]|uniref:uncharacterized protein n=1 Tax=Cantharellus anzutake TaxID=1750568 RepID=UPI00190354A1|nr:uncharacterized protein EI90DRAFT_3062037 [Cantharellus anzutake]KAF8329795.1 hypothetical protein EI90DRAFT_3062037 [Cantharellus anzutake]